MTPNPRPLLLLLALCLLVPLAAAADDAAVDWREPGDEASLASDRGKPILYFVTADWCAPCHQMKKTVFADPEKVERIESWYVPVEVHDTRAERGVNHPDVDEVLERYGVSSIPTLIVALPDGTEVALEAGYRGPSHTWRWIRQHAQAARSRLAP